MASKGGKAPGRSPGSSEWTGSNREAGAFGKISTFLPCGFYRTNFDGSIHHIIHQFHHNFCWTLRWFSMELCWVHGEPSTSHNSWQRRFQMVIQTISLFFFRFQLVSVGFSWFQLVSVGSFVGFSWFQLVSVGFSWFQLVSVFDFLWPEDLEKKDIFQEFGKKKATQVSIVGKLGRVTWAQGWENWRPLPVLWRIGLRHLWGFPKAQS